MNSQSNNYDPVLYNLIHRGNDGDKNFYLNICADSMCVLELGCGTGRIVMDMARLGKRVVGLDKNSLMLSQLRSNLMGSTYSENITLTEGDMSSFELGERFDRVIIPYNGLLCLLSEDSVVSCFRSVAKHLNDNGLLLFDMYHVDNDAISESKNETEDYEPLVSTELDADTIDIFERHLPNLDSHRFDVSYLYRIISNQKTREVEYTIEQRCIYPNEVSSLLERAGLQMVTLLSDFSQDPICEETDQVVVVASLKS